MEFSREEYWSGLPFPSPGDLPNPGIEPRSPALQADSLPSEPSGKLDFVEDSGNISSKIFFFYMDNFWNLYWICHNIVSVLCFVFFGHDTCGLLAPWPRIEPVPSALEGKVLTTGTSGKSLDLRIDWKGGMMEFWGADRLFLFKLIYFFIYLAVLGLSYVLWGLDLWTGIKPGLPALGAEF